MSLSLPTICITILLKSKYDERPVSLWHIKNDNTLKNIHLKTLTKTETICNKNTNENAHNRQFRHRNCSQSARAVGKWEGLAYAYECVIPAEFYCCSLFFDLLTLNFFLTSCAYLAQSQTSNIMSQQWPSCSESLLLYQEELHVAKAVHLLSKWAAANKLALYDGAAVHALPQLLRTISGASSQPIINPHHHRTMTSTGKMLTVF